MHSYLHGSGSQKISEKGVLLPYLFVSYLLSRKFRVIQGRVPPKNTKTRVPIQFQFKEYAILDPPHTSSSLMRASTPDSLSPAVGRPLQDASGDGRASEEARAAGRDVKDPRSDSENTLYVSRVPRLS
jgi:hypothetical protein